MKIKHLPSSGQSKKSQDALKNGLIGAWPAPYLQQVASRFLLGPLKLEEDTVTGGGIAMSLTCQSSDNSGALNTDTVISILLLICGLYGSWLSLCFLDSSACLDLFSFLTSLDRPDHTAGSNKLFLEQIFIVFQALQFICYIVGPSYQWVFHPWIHSTTD